jgi:hypothetical protein
MPQEGKILTNLPDYFITLISHNSKEIPAL